MKNLNNEINDNELRLLMNSILLDEKDESILKLSDMESSIVMENEALFIPDVNKEAALLNRLGKDFSKRSGLSWWWILPGVILISAGFYFTQPDKNEITPVVSTSGMQQQQNPEPARPAINQVAPTAENHITEGHIELVNDAPLEVNTPPPAEAEENHPPVSENNSGTYMASSPSPEFHPQVENTFHPQDVTDEFRYPIDTVFSGVKQLEVYGIYFPVNVNMNSSDQVFLKGEMRVEGTSKRAKKTRFEIEYQRKGDVLKATVIEHRKQPLIQIGESMRIEGFLNFTVPEGTDIIIKNLSGDVYVKGATGKVCKLHSNYGSITAENIGTDLHASSSSGNINVRSVKGLTDVNSDYGNLNLVQLTGNVKAVSSSGNTSINDVTGELALDSKYGNNVILKVRGNVSVEASSGNVEIEDVEGNWCNIRSNYGRIHCTSIKAKMILKAQSGDIRVKKIDGEMDVNSLYGSQDLSDIKGNLSSYSSSGSVVLSSHEGNVKVRCLYGDVRLTDCKGNFSIEDQSGDIRLRNMTVSDTLEVSNSYGNINLHLLNDFNELSYDLSTGSGNIFLSDSLNTDTSSKSHYLRIRGNKWIKANAQSGDIRLN